MTSLTERTKKKDSGVMRYETKGIKERKSGRMRESARQVRGDKR